MDNEDFQRPRWRKWLLNRFVVTPLIIALIAGAWDLYANMHNNGLVEGRVVDAGGRPVTGADVTLWTFNFTTFSEKSRTTSGPDGRFTFTDNPSHHIQVSATKPGVGTSQRRPIRLFFQSQDTQLEEPLVLAGGA
ncbi:MULTISPECIES: carboxypeptidase-like regulatory domain-containing protein [unclassified Chelatococcus]|uniref:carboxypeptidase-like regulatory domain-containing protein n=1 Tax=unclassified Chelatococcus TaxID=2638111 RepID=UPI001BCBA501|nr:carboxypeptidase-like regulatory domain-containing protein [Chelatococcus sp.]MBS7739720.1 carboxypeptidase regulatory-like domain-containing protein [Chelatococcus sp. HY11]CAH1650341.1 Carboxypeptidase family protein [Hyphomicrobiales bacterium]MBX3544089.1 carboxypeptidase regulatory-like domain-containing protein [Chelatococcus sp.]MCO5075744.1 carboxypeptidase-like regulatory domain-containing protein [Chelatococcus sp.]CAH1666404.1 Carboxypeptidase family protein [Hyphomicrobiales bac